MTLTARIVPVVEVSWDGTGRFDGPYDDVTSDVIGESGVSIASGKDGSRTLDPPKVSSVGFDVINDDGAYSQENAGSPVYQLVLPGRPVRISATIGAADVYDGHTPYDETDPYDGVATYALATAALDDIGQQAELGDRRVSFAALGIESLLVASKATVALMTNPLVSDCVTAILDAVGWPSSDRAIATSDTRLLYFWADDRDPWSALLELLAAEGPGAMYCDGSGVFHFENRNYRTTTARSMTSQGDFYDTHGGGPSAYDEPDAYDAHDGYDGRSSGLWFTGLTYDPGFRNIYNRATYATRQRALQPLGVIWSYGTTLALGGGETTTLIAHPSDPFQDAVTPIAPTDYAVDGGTVSVTLSAPSGLVAFVTIAATSGVPTVTGLQLRGRPLTSAYETTVQNAVDASASIARFSVIPGRNIPRVLDVAGWPEIDQANAVAVCDAWVNRYQTQRPSVTIALRNADAAHVRQMLGRAVSDRIRLTERNTGLAADVWVNAIRHEVRGPGSVWTTVLGCEKAEEVLGSVWDVGRWDSAVWGV